jgi:hypothetical protein
MNVWVSKSTKLKEKRLKMQAKIEEEI